MSLSLDWPEPSLWPNSRVHWSKRSRLRRAQHTMAYARALSHKFSLKSDAKLFVVFKSPTNRHFDLDNALAAMKGAIDGLAQASRCDDRGWSYEVSKGAPVRGGAVLISTQALPQDAE